MLKKFPIFLSVVLVVRNQQDRLQTILTEIADTVSDLVGDYEIVVVDNASEDESVAVLKRLTAGGGLPNLQVFALTKEVDPDTAAWAGLENALGDFVALLDPLTDDVGFLPAMLAEAAAGADVVFAANALAPRQGLAYRALSAVFNATYRWFNGVHLGREAPQYRLLSRRVVNFVLQHPAPAISYRHLPATGGFARRHLSYSTPPRARPDRSLWEGVDRGMRLLVSTTRGPMRLVTALSLFGALANALYSVYVIAVALARADVAPGWVTLSLQQSGMFLLISLVLLVLGEYILHMASLSDGGPPYHVAQEFTSEVLTRRNRLNVEEAGSASGAPVVNLLRRPVAGRPGAGS